MKISIFTDGGSRGNPGPSAIGVVVRKDGMDIKKYAESIGEGTNNEAEYKAIIFALKKLKLLFGKKKALELEVEVNMDSELVAKQLNHEYKVKEKEIQDLFIEVWNLMINYKKVTFKHIFRERNKEADKLVNEALNNQTRKQSLF